VDLKYFAYKPFWGGFLNPLLGTFFGIGLIECSRHVSDRRVRWVLVAFPVFFIPALLTNDLETFRIIQVLPLLLVVTAVGIRGTLLQVKVGARPWFLALVLAASLGMDIHHLTGPYAGFWKKNPLQWGDYAKSRDAYEAYELLRGLRDSQGPGAVLLGTQWDSDDQALLTATFPFNAAANPSLSLDSVRWAVLFTDSDEAPLFAKAFPEGHYRAAHWGVKNLAASLVWIQSKGLEIVPVTEKDRPLVKKWVRIDRCLEEEFFLELNIPPNSPHGPAIQYMKDHFPVFSGDPLTEYFYWVRMQEICQKAGDDPGELEAMRRVVGRSDLARPYQWYRFAVLLVKSRHFEEARSAFRQAGRLNPSFLPPPAVFQKLEEEIAKGKRAL
jgi:hypothetical protein